MMKMNKTRMFVIGLFLITILAMGIQPGQATAGAVGELDVTSTSFDDFSLTVTAKDLTDGSAYYITSSPDEGTTNTTEYGTAAVDGDKIVIHFSVSTPADKTLEIYLSGAENSGVTIDTAVVYYPDEDDFSIEFSLY
jgi:hypothetical protein